MLTRRHALAVLALPVVTACTSQPAAPVAAATAAPAVGTTLDARSFAAAVQLPGAIVLDVRTPQEFRDGHLAQAVNVDVGASDFATRLEKLDKAVPYAVYCRSGNRSATAMGIMQKSGFRSYFHLGGGIGAWQAAGYPVVKG